MKHQIVCFPGTRAAGPSNRVGALIHTRAMALSANQTSSPPFQRNNCDGHPTVNSLLYITIAINFLCDNKPESAAAGVHLSKTPVERYRSPLSHTIATTMAFSVSPATCSAANMFPPDEMPQKSPSSAAIFLEVSSA